MFFSKITSAQNKEKLKIELEKNPEGFTEGRLHFKLSEKGKKNSSHKGMHWFTNDLDDIIAFECPVGYHPGKCKKKEQN